MTAETFSAIAGALLSLAAAYLPGFSGWFAGLGPVWKRALLLGMLALAAGGCLAIGCAGWGVELARALGEPAPSCDAPGVLQATRAFVMALLANQATYQMTAARTPRHEALEALKRIETPDPMRVVPIRVARRRVVPRRSTARRERP